MSYLTIHGHWVGLLLWLNKAIQSIHCLNGKSFETTIKFHRPWFWVWESLVEIRGNAFHGMERETRPVWWQLLSLTPLNSSLIVAVLHSLILTPRRCRHPQWLVRDTLRNYGVQFDKPRWSKYLVFCRDQCLVYHWYSSPYNECVVVISCGNLYASEKFIVSYSYPWLQTFHTHDKTNVPLSLSSTTLKATDILFPPLLITHL